MEAQMSEDQLELIYNSSVLEDIPEAMDDRDERRKRGKSMEAAWHDDDDDDIISIYIWRNLPSIITYEGQKFT